MASNIHFVCEIRQALVAGVVLAIQTATASGPINADYLGGILALAKHQAATFGIPWSYVANDARLALGAIVGDAERRLGADLLTLDEALEHGLELPEDLE